MRGTGEQMAVGHALDRALGDVCRLVDQRAFAAEDHPEHRPGKARDAERAERPVPGMVDDDPVERRHGDDDAERRALGDDRRRHAAQRVGKPLVDRVQGHRRGRPFARAQDDAAGDQHLERDRAQHGELHDRPDDRHDQKRVAGLDAIGDEADHDAGDREQEEERRAEQAELLGTQLQLGHDRLGGEAHHHLVGEVDQHEQEEQGGHAPRAFEGPRLVCHVLVPPARMRQEQHKIDKGRASRRAGRYPTIRTPSVVGGNSLRLQQFLAQRSRLHERLQFAIGDDERVSSAQLQSTRRGIRVGPERAVLDPELPEVNG